MNEPAQASLYYLPVGLPQPVPENDGLSTPFWQGARDEKLMVQRCKQCSTWQWGPEWICHNCLSFDVGWQQVEGVGRIFSWERSHHPVHAALKGHGAYISLLVELTQADNVRMLGNLLGDPAQDVKIGADVRVVFEHHQDVERPYTLVQWRYA